MLAIVLNLGYWCSAGVVFTVIVVYFYLRVKFHAFFNLKVQTIQLKVPEVMSNGEVMRSPQNRSMQLIKLLDMEAQLRLLAYNNTPIIKGTSFYDDSDMISPYFLVVVYERKSNTPLLSSRYYYDKTSIEKWLSGDNHKIEDSGINLNEYENGKLFLADRLSGNSSNPIYKKYRSFIFALFYAEIVKHNANSHLILMARSEKQERLLSKYIRLGFNITGTTEHKGKKHWIVITDIKQSKSYLKKAIKSFNFLLILSKRKSRIS